MRAVNNIGLVLLTVMPLAACSSAFQVAAQSPSVGSPVQNCTASSTSPDSDIRRAAAAIEASGLCYTEQEINENGMGWKLSRLTNPARASGPLWVVLHDDEDAAFVAALHGVSSYGGTLVSVESGERRDMQGQDPNRNFGSGASCRQQLNPSPAFTAALLSGQRSSIVIALHSNGNGSGGGISAELTTSTMQGMMSPSAQGTLRDPDNAVLVAGTQSNGAADARVGRILDAGMNVIYEFVHPATNDCSLSNYLVLNGGPRYLNIEVEDGNGGAAIAMVDLLARIGWAG